MSQNPTRSANADAEFAVVILAGGEARRFPGKLRAELRGATLLERAVANFAGAPARVLAVDAAFDRAEAERLGVPCVVDATPGRGPLAGLLSALGAFDARWFFAAAGDAPFVDLAFAEELWNAREAGDEALVPRVSAGGEVRPQPLAAFYERTAFAPAARAELAEGRGSLLGTLARLRTHYVEIGRPSRFTNINTPEDLARLVD